MSPSQQQLPELIETTQSVISRLEDADDEGRSLSMLERIATALKQKRTVVMTASGRSKRFVRRFTEWSRCFDGLVG